MASVADRPYLEIEPPRGVVTGCNSAALDLLGLEAPGPVGERWTAALGAAGPQKTALGAVVSSARPLQLPPFLARRGDGQECVLGGLFLPPGEAATERAALLLWPLFADALGGLAPPGTGDTLVVLGIDAPAGEEQGAARERLMRRVRDSLGDIVRARDAVSEPVGDTLAILLRDVDLPAAADICRALLSHLARVLGGAKTARVGVGMARMRRGRSALATLLAANHALLRWRCGIHVEQLNTEQADDYAVLLAAAAGVGGVLSAHPEAPQVARPTPAPRAADPPPVQPIEKDIEGYVVDNMEGAVDQALFLAGLDVPVAIVGPAGTGKAYVARMVHEAWGGAPDALVAIDCRDFRGRREAIARIGRELAAAEGRTLVFKSPHLMNAEAQLRLARQISTRTLADSSPPRALPRCKFVALFPDAMDRLLRRGELAQPLASVFAGFPITVPPIRDRKQAVLRWAHKILGQEGALRDRDMKGFTPDAERAMLQYDWPGNISEMRRCIRDALDKTGKDWLTPVDLGLFKGIDPEGTADVPQGRPFLEIVESAGEDSDTYTPSAIEAVDVALAEAVHALLQLELVKPLGAWLEDDVVVAALERYRGDTRRASEFLHTRPRNIGRWLPKIQAREAERNASALWQAPRRLLREWVRESPHLEEPPLQRLQGMLLVHLERQAGTLSSARRAQIMGVSTPTYLKRLRESAGE